MLKIYSFLTLVLGFIVLAMIYVIRLVQGKDVASRAKKTGNFELPVGFDKSKKTVMVHGVSVGEIVSLEKLIRRIKTSFPECNLVVTTGTKAGQETAIKKMGSTVDFITYFPFDIPPFVKKFLDKISPDVVLIAETEIWPVFAYNCFKKGIPVFIINGRMSDKSFKSYKFLSPFFKSVLPLYSGVFVQSEVDKTRLETIGARNAEVMKNLKFDIGKFKVDLEFDAKKILIAGSTHRGEDEIVIDTYKKLKDACPNLKLLLAPRHITRTDAVIELLKKSGLAYNLYSKTPDFKNADVLLLDVMGELAKLYSVCDVAFIGGSFDKTGGHNPLEAVIFNKPVISGPSVKNFRDIYSILSANGAGFVVKTSKEFFDVANKLLTNEDFYKTCSQNSINVFNNQQGALEFVIRKLESVI